METLHVTFKIMLYIMLKLSVNIAFSVYSCDLESASVPFFLPSFLTNKKANSSRALFICEHRIFAWNLIKYCGCDVTAAGIVSHASQLH